MPSNNNGSKSKPSETPIPSTRHDDGGGAPGPRFPIPCPPKPATKPPKK